MPKVKSVIVIDYYEGIRGFLALREDFPYKDFLANPRLRTQTEIVWATDVFKEKPILLSDIQGVLKERYSSALKEQIDALGKVIEKLKEEDSDSPIIDLLVKSISYIDEHSVYCGDGNIVVVNWGLIPRHPELGYACIYKNGKYVNNWDVLHTYKEVEIAEELPIYNIERDSSSHKEVSMNVERPESYVNAVKEKNKELDQPDSLDVHTVAPLIPKESPKMEDMEKKESDEPVKQKKEVAKPILEEGEVKKPKETPKMLDEKIDKYEEEYTWATFGNNLWKGIIFFFRKIWWILLLLLLLLLLAYLCRGYQGAINQWNPFYSPLPEHPVILPVEKGSTGLSSDGMYRIATDRLKILLDDEGDDSMLRWAKAFKKEYSSADYEIFYYNKDLNCLLIKVPSDKREQVKKEINNKLDDFSFDVFDELLYGLESVSFNDPELVNAMRAWYLKAIHAFEAWNISYGDSGIVVAVVDNGFDVTHPELKGKIVHPYNVLLQNTDLFPVEDKEYYEHGTHVAATAVGNGNNGTGLLGIAPACKLIPIQVGDKTGSISDQAVMDGVMYAINQGADVINVSLGQVISDAMKKMSEGQQLNYINTAQKQNELLWRKVYEKARQRNCTVVFAAGNDNMIAGVDPQKRSNEIICVSAVNKKLDKADFSNYGVFPQLNRSYSTISAPGVSIYSAKPGGGYVSCDGTSMAAPIVSGTVALMKSLDRNLTTSQVVTILQETGQQVNKKIGPLFNLKKALQVANGEKVPGKCEEITMDVQRLQFKIDSLLQICPDAAVAPDTLAYHSAVKNKHGLDGLWKASTPLVSADDNTPVQLYMQFKKLKGTLTIVNKGFRYTAPLEAKIKKGKITITQTAPAVNGNDSFSPYRYTCTADRKGYLVCTAQKAKESLTFNLVRIK